MTSSEFDPGGAAATRGRETRGPREGSRGAADDGYSLIEVLAAAALLSGILLAIMGMFVYGGQSVNSGKMMTKATALSNDVLEQFRLFTFKQTYKVIEDDGNAAIDKHYTWNSATNLPNWPTETSYQGILNDWNAQVKAALPKGEMTVTVRGLRDLGTNPPEETFEKARVLQIVVTIRWVERKRNRSVVFETLKV